MELGLLLTSVSIKRFIYLIAVTSIIFSLYYYQSNSQAYWLVWSALCLSLIATGNTLSRRILYITLIGCAAILAVIIAGVLAPYTLFYALYLFVITLSGIALAQIYPEYFLFLFIVNLFAILSGSFTPSTGEMMSRVMYILMGLLITLFLQLIFGLFYRRQELRFWLLRSVHNLKLLNKEIFSCLLQIEYRDNLYLFERRLHIQKTKYIKSAVCLREIQNQSGKEKTAALLSQLDRIYEVMLDCSIIRNRVSDPNTFAICKEELTEISRAIDNNFLQLEKNIEKRSREFKLDVLGQKIRRMEENYHNVLQIAAREPLVFLLFISSLNLLSKEMMGFHETVLRF